MDPITPEQEAQHLTEAVEKAGEALTERHLENTNPALAVEILSLRGKGESYDKIAAATGVTKKVVWRICQNSPEAVKLIQDATATKAVGNAHKIFDVMEMKTDMLKNDPEELKKTNIKDLALAGGIAVDKAQLLQGKATSITESKSGHDKEALAQMVKEAHLRKAQGKVIDVESNQEEDQG